MKRKIIAVLCISMLSTTLSLTGCSSKEQAKDSVQDTLITETETNQNDTTTTTETATTTTEAPADEQQPTNDIIGDWVLDWDMTDANNETPLNTEFGSGIHMVDSTLTFNDDSNFSWYLGIGNGGIGTYVNENGEITGTYISDIGNLQHDIHMTLSDGEIIMNIRGDNSYSVYWKRN